MHSREQTPDAPPADAIALDQFLLDSAVAEFLFRARLGRRLVPRLG